LFSLSRYIFSVAISSCICSVIALLVSFLLLSRRDFSCLSVLLLLLSSAAAACCRCCRRSSFLLLLPPNPKRRRRRRRFRDAAPHETRRGGVSLSLSLSLSLSIFLSLSLSVCVCVCVCLSVARCAAVRCYSKRRKFIFYFCAYSVKYYFLANIAFSMFSIRFISASLSLRSFSKACSHAFNLVST